MCICVVSLYVCLLSRLSYLGISSSSSSHGFFLLVFPLGLVGHLSPKYLCLCVMGCGEVHATVHVPGAYNYALYMSAHAQIVCLPRDGELNVSSSYAFCALCVCVQ